MTLVLEAKARSGKPEATRAEGLIPAVVYGPHMEAISVAVPYTPFEKLYSEAGESTILSLQLEGQEAMDVMIKDIQLDPMKGRFMHADFRAVTKGEEMEVAVTLQFEGAAPAEKLGGTLVKAMDTITVRTLPKDLVDHIVVDLGVLATFDDAIQVRDLTIPAGMTVMDDVSSLVAKVSAPLSEEQLQAMEETTPSSVEDVQVEEKGKKEDDAAAEA